MRLQLHKRSERRNNHEVPHPLPLSALRLCDSTPSRCAQHPPHRLGGQRPGTRLLRRSVRPHAESRSSSPAEGVRFNRAFVPQAGCSQSRASFLTGLYPHQHGQIGLATWGFRLYREDTPNLPRSLKAAGYRTGIIGKLHINPESAFPFDFHEITGANFASQATRRLREDTRRASSARPRRHFSSA